MRLNIYCDESISKGKYYSRFYGGAILNEKDRIYVEDRILSIKEDTIINGEMKWVKINAHNEKDYIEILDVFFDLMYENFVKVRIMFMQNTNSTEHLNYSHDEAYLKLYYQFLKHSFGLSNCNPRADHDISIAIFLDEIPESNEKFDEFKLLVSKLSNNPHFIKNRISIHRSDITSINSKNHPILQLVDIILGAMQFRLNNHHKNKAEGKRTRGKRTLAKERVYKHILKRIREGYPNFNIGISTGKITYSDLWTHPYRHWSFIPQHSKVDLSKSKAYERKNAPRSV